MNGNSSLDMNVNSHHTWIHAAISQINFQLTLEKEESLTNKCHYQFTLDKIKMTLDWKERFVQLTLDCNRWQFSCLYIFALLKTWHWCPLYINTMRHRRSRIITIRHSRTITRRHRVKNGREMCQYKNHLEWKRNHIQPLVKEIQVCTTIHT